MNEKGDLGDGLLEHDCVPGFRLARRSALHENSVHVTRHEYACTFLRERERPQSTFFFARKYVLDCAGLGAEYERATFLCVAAGPR